MKKLLILCLLLTSCWGAGELSDEDYETIGGDEAVEDSSGNFFKSRESGEAETSLPTDVRVYVSIVTHSEEWKSAKSGEPNYVEDEEAFWERRAQVVAFANMLHEEGVKYNYQSDWTFLLAATKFDDGDSSTNGKNILRYLKEDLGFEIDPHGHETTYNMADVAYLINELGVKPSNTAGGYIALPAEKSKLEYYWKTITGNKYNYKWKAKILWGGGTANHVDEAELWYSGIWRPKDDENSTVHDEDAPLINVGRYMEGWEALEYLLEQDLEAGKIYTLSVMGHQRDLDAEFIAEFRSQIQKFKEDSRIHWAGIAEVVDIWESEYNGEANQLKYDGPVEEDSSGFGTGLNGGGLQGGGSLNLKSKVLNQ